MLSSPHNTRRWERHHVDLPVRLIIANGLSTSSALARATEISRNGMAVHSTLALKLGDLMQVQFPISNPSGVTAVVRNRRDNCFGLEFLPQASLSEGALGQTNVVCQPSAVRAPGAPPMTRPSCTPKALLAGLRRKRLEMKQLQREIEAIKLAIPLLADEEKKNPESSRPRRLELEKRPWPARP